MASRVDIEFEVDEVSKTDLDNSSQHNVTHLENNQSNLPKNLFFQLDPNWGRKSLPYSFEKVLPSIGTSGIIITDECPVPSSTDNSTHQHIQQNILLESPMESKAIQCNLCEKIVKSAGGLKIHERSCKSNFLDDKQKLLDEVSEPNNIVTRATEDNTNKISKVPSEEYE